MAIGGSRLRAPAFAHPEKRPERGNISEPRRRPARAAPRSFIALYRYRHHGIDLYPVAPLAARHARRRARFPVHPLHRNAAATTAGGSRATAQAAAGTARRPTPAGAWLMLTLAEPNGRLRLRDFLPSDLDAYLAVRRGAAFGRHYAVEQTRADFSARLLSGFLAQQRQSPRRDWQLAIVRADGALIGSAGLRGVDAGEAEFGIELAEAAWRQGYAVEAAGLMLAFGRERLACRRIRAHCAPGNVAMLSLARKLGFDMQPLRDGRRLDLLLAA
ncbi:hypothetical protein DK842_07775 [Chromobacterium phragmitis]|nr:hypothetical protein DK842_07775 [Chromobacterium phragmitis]